MEDAERVKSLSPDTRVLYRHVVENQASFYQAEDPGARV
jgi:hypothetical protein